MIAGGPLKTNIVITQSKAAIPAITSRKVPNRRLLKIFVLKRLASEGLSLP